MAPVRLRSQHALAGLSSCTGLTAQRPGGHRVQLAARMRFRMHTHTHTHPGGAAVIEVRLEASRCAYSKRLGGMHSGPSANRATASDTRGWGGEFLIADVSVTAAEYNLVKLESLALKAVRSESLAK